MSNDDHSSLKIVTDRTTEHTENGNGESVLPVNPGVVSAKELQIYLHDINGPLASARGFTEELLDVRRCMKDLMTKPDIASNEEHFASLQDQIDNEMEFCLDRVDRSLADLDSVLEIIRARITQHE